MPGEIAFRLILLDLAYDTGVVGQHAITWTNIDKFCDAIQRH